MLGAVRSEGLAAAVAAHLAETKEHGPRLEEVFRALAAEPSSNLDPTLDKLIQHHDDLAGSFADDRLADVFHVAAAAATEHHELAAYDTLLALGRAVELPESARAHLGQNRAEEADALGRLQSELGRLVDELGR